MTEPKFDAALMGKLAKSLAFICSKDHPCVAALAKAAETGRAAGGAQHAVVRLEGGVTCPQP